MATGMSCSRYLLLYYGWFSRISSNSRGRGPAYVRNTNSLCLAGLQDGFHLFPGVHMVVTPDHVSRTIGELRKFVIVTY